MNGFVKPLAMVLGVVLTLVGIAGFFVEGSLLWFEVDPLHNIVHILSGVIGLVAASTSEGYARMYLIVFGIVYAVVAVLGFATGGVLGLLSVNDADNYLHAAIAVVCLVVGFGSQKSATA